MLLLTLTFLSGSCLVISSPLTTDKEAVYICVANITNQYFKETKSLAYFNPKSETNQLLKILHAMEIITFSRGKSDVVNPNLAYMIVLEYVQDILQNKELSDLFHETNWNPYARILVIFKYIGVENLFQIFDVFLRHRAYNVVVLNGTLTTELYTYNPFENFACGRYYSRIIHYGKCSEVTADIYPSKAITGLKNCFFNVSVPHWPPWGIDPSKLKTGPNAMGTEQYIFDLISEIEQFKYKFNIDYDPEAFSMVSQNLTITGPMMRLMENQTDFMLGGLILIPSRAKVFSFISGHVDYLEEIKVMVKKAEIAAAWKNFYLEFSGPVWALLLFSLLLYSAVVAILLKTKDKGRVILVLMESFLSHGARFRVRQSVQSVVFMWVLFAFLVNSYYTTSLMSLTTKPPTDYQVHDEASLIKYQFKPCISSVMGQYMQSEQNHGEILKDVKFATKGCESLIDSIKTVSKTHLRFTIVLYSIYSFYDLNSYYRQETPTVYLFTRPYTKVIYGMYFNKGLPLRERLCLLAIRIRETGLSEKNLKDHFFNRTLYSKTKHDVKIHAEGLVTHFAIPWYLYAVGVSISVITFMVELASRYNKVQVVNK